MAFKQVTVILLVSFAFSYCLPIPKRMNIALGRELYNTLASANSTCFNAVLSTLKGRCLNNYIPDPDQVKYTASNMMDCFEVVSPKTAAPHCGANMSCVLQPGDSVLKWADLASLVMPLCEHLKFLNKTYVELLSDSLSEGGIAIFPEIATQTIDWCMRQWLIRIILSQVFYVSQLKT